VPPRDANIGRRPVRKGGPKRLLAEEDYLCSFLFAPFNPIIDSMRGLCAASDFPRVQAEIYRGRWEIELFFRWLKCVSGRPAQWHWLAQSPEGVGIQLYTALIAALLLCRRMGKLPGKRVMEVPRWHQSGMIDTATLTRALATHGVKKPA
jgi:hypothetical protein